MPDTSLADSPAIQPATLPNPVVPGGFMSPLERHMQQVESRPAQSAEPGFDSTAFEQARAADKARANGQPVPQQAPPANATPQQRSDSERSLLQPRKPGVNQRDHAKRTSQDWSTLKSERDNLQRELDAYRAGNKPANVSGGDTLNGSASNTQPGVAPNSPTLIDLTQNDEFKKLKAERDAFYEEIKHVRVEADPEFKAKFDTKRDAAVRIARSVSGAAADDVARILQINDPDLRQAQLAERIKDFSDGSKQRIMAAAGQIAVVEVEREMEIVSRKATWDQTKAQREASEQARFSQRMSKLDAEYGQVWQQWNDPEKGMPFLADDKVRAAVEPVARRIFSGDSTPRELAESALKAALFPEILKAWQQSLGEVQRLQGNTDLYRSSYPGDEHAGYTQTTNQPPPVNVTGYDPHFANGLAAARARDGFK